MTHLAPADQISFDDQAAPLAAVSAKAVVQRVRWRLGLNQADFARLYRINPDKLRDVEQEKVAPDGAFLAYLALIERAPAAMRDALDEPRSFKS